MEREIVRRESQYEQSVSFCESINGTTLIAIARNPHAHDTDPLRYRFEWTPLRDFAIEIWPVIEEAEERRTQPGRITPYLGDAIREFDYPAQNAEIPAVWGNFGSDWLEQFRGMVVFGNLKSYKEDVEKYRELREEVVSIAEELHQEMEQLSKRKYWRPRLLRRN